MTVIVNTQLLAFSDSELYTAEVKHDQNFFILFYIYDKDVKKYKLFSNSKLRKHLNNKKGIS